MKTILGLWAVLLLFPATAGDLEAELGRREFRIMGAPFPLWAGSKVQDMGLVPRLDALDYERVHGKPVQAGRYFWGYETFWIYRRSHRLRGKQFPALLFGLSLRKKDGLVTGAVDHEGRPLGPEAWPLLWLEPQVLSESPSGDRAVRFPLCFADLPEIVWRPLLAAEDARFFDHMGLDGRSLARSMLANFKAKKVVQGGSTITQQLVKNRDLTPKRSMGRKLSEAVRALALEAEYDKEEILESYLNHVYLGHVDGWAVHGYGAGARVYFSKPPEQLNLAEAALLAGIIQGPNGRSPIRHPARAKKRRDWVIGRMEQLGWATSQQAQAAKGRELGLKLSPARGGGYRHFLGWVQETMRRDAPRRSQKKLGMVVETTLDPYLQEMARDSLQSHLAALGRRFPKLADLKLNGALVSLNAETGEVLAYVGGDPSREEDRYDRVRLAKRQPGSTIKPLLLLEAFAGCGSRRALHAASRIEDRPIRIDLPNGPWFPKNNDDRFHGTVDLRTALRHSYNVPFVRLGRWCGFTAMADRLRDLGLVVPEEAPPSLVLGALEVSPLQMASAYSVFTTPGRRWSPLPVRRIERPGGRGLENYRLKTRKAAKPTEAYLVYHLLRDVVASGSGQGAKINGMQVAGKTGTTSDRRDAWFVGTASGLLTVVWVGLDEGTGARLEGGGIGAPLWKSFMEKALPTRPPYEVPRPEGLIEAYVDPATGLLVGAGKKGARRELFREGAIPRRNRWWRSKKSEPIIE